LETMRWTIVSGNASSSFVADRSIRTSCTATAVLQAAALHEAVSDRGPRFSRLPLTRLGGRHVENVFPKTAALAQIDHHCCPLAVLVKQEFHASDRVNRSPASE